MTHCALVRVVLRMALHTVHRATAVTIGHLILATRINALVQMEMVQPVLHALHMALQRAVHATLVTNCQVVRAFGSNVAVQMESLTVVRVVLRMD